MYEIAVLLLGALLNIGGVQPAVESTQTESIQEVQPTETGFVLPDGTRHSPVSRFGGGDVGPAG